MLGQLCKSEIFKTNVLVFFYIKIKINKGKMYTLLNNIIYIMFYDTLSSIRNSSIKSVLFSFFFEEKCFRGHFNMNLISNIRFLKNIPMIRIRDSRAVQCLVSRESRTSQRSSKIFSRVFLIRQLFYYKCKVAIKLFYSAVIRTFTGHEIIYEKINKIPF